MIPPLLLPSLLLPSLLHSILSSLLLSSTSALPQLDMTGNVRGKVKMGEKRVDCDDGASMLEVDWDGSPVNYTCYSPTTPLLPRPLEPLLECTQISPNYQPRHFCMAQPIAYSAAVPTFGDHRPIWPKFGEYRFVPAQRWLHNIEHGAVVLLYHPCTHHTLVDRLRALVKGCIRKHIISPSTHVTAARPLVLVAWGCTLAMSRVDEQQVVSFIRAHGLKGPEGSYPKEGQYTEELVELAVAPPGSDIEDSHICPNHT